MHFLCVISVMVFDFDTGFFVLLFNNRLHFDSLVAYCVFSLVSFVTVTVVFVVFLAFPEFPI